MAKVQGIFHNYYYAFFSFQSHDGSFSDLHYENLVVFLEVSPRKCGVPPKTVVLRKIFTVTTVHTQPAEIHQNHHLHVSKFIASVAAPGQLILAVSLWMSLSLHTSQ